MAFSIWYADGSRVDGAAARDWRAAPAHGVQVVVRWKTPPVGWRPWAGVTDRELWTGTDTYNPFGYGVKTGSRIDWADYSRLWDLAAYGAR